MGIINLIFLRLHIRQCVRTFLIATSLIMLVSLLHGIHNQAKLLMSKESTLLHSHAKHHSVTSDFADKLKSDAEHFLSKHNLTYQTVENPIKVVLVTQYRGGSTFLGEIFNFNPDAFYWYEPLVAPTFEFKHSIKTEFPFQLTSGKIRTLPEDFLRTVQNILLNILNCNINDLDMRVLSHYFITAWTKSKKIVPYKKCLDNNKTAAHINECKHVLTENCQGSKFRSIKTIRFMLYMSERMIQEDSSVKFILYVRDPRGTILSQWGLEQKLRQESPKMQKLRANIHCTRLMHDHKFYRKIIKKYPLNFLLIRYEDLAHMPMQTTEKIYQFLGFSVPRDVVEWIETHTQSEKKNGAMGTLRNSSVTAERWHTDMTSKEQAYITSQCKLALKTFGYTI